MLTRQLLGRHRRWRRLSIGPLATAVVLLAAPSASATVAADGPSGGPSVSSTGRFVAFTSSASNLTSPPSAGGEQVYVRDRVTGSTRRVSVPRTGAEPDGTSRSLRISANGRYVLFASDASNLVPGDVDALSNLFVRDRWTSRTRRVSVLPDGSAATSGAGDMSADGRQVAFLAPGANGASLYQRDLATGTTRLLAGTTVFDDGSSRGPLGAPVLSRDGSRVAYPDYYSTHAGDMDEGFAVLDTATGAGVVGRTCGKNGGCPQLALSGDGRLLAVTQWLPFDLRDATVHDLGGGRERLLEDAEAPSLSHSGRYLAVRDRAASRLAVIDLRTGTRAHAPVDAGGVLSGDGNVVAFSSPYGLLPADTNRRDDVYTWDRSTGALSLVSAGR